MSIVTYTGSLGNIIGDGVLVVEGGIASSINSNPSASGATNYYLRDLGNGIWASTALPTGISFPTVTVTGATQQMASNNRYSVNSTQICTLTMPASPAVGDTISVHGAGLNSSFNFVIETGASQTISDVTGTSNAGVILTSTQPGAGITFFASSSGTSANWAISQVNGLFANS